MFVIITIIFRCALINTVHKVVGLLCCHCVVIIIVLLFRMLCSTFCLLFIILLKEINCGLH